MCYEKSLKDWIKSEVINEKGKVSPWISRLDKHKPLVEAILAATEKIDTPDISEKIYCILNNIPQTPKCPYCDNGLRYHRSLGGYAETCSQVCMKKNPELIKKLSDNMKRQIKNGFIEHSNKVKMERYGSLTNHKKYKETMLSRYGVENYFQTPEARKIASENAIKKRAEVLKENYPEDVYNKLMDEAFLREEHLVKKKSILQISNETGINYGTLRNHYRKYNISTEIVFSSALEATIETYIRTIRTDYLRNQRRGFKNSELDFYFPSIKLGIEINGSYWHSAAHKADDYHIDKKQHFSDLDIHILNIYEHDWYNQQNKIKSIIANLLGQSIKIPARKCGVRFNIDSKEQLEFLNANHFQGYVSSSKSVGLYYHNELIGLATFGKPRYNTLYEYELLRLCFKSGVSVIGGSQKLFTNFIKQYSPKSIISYCDVSKFPGHVYTKLGFTLSHISQPGYQWVHKKTFDTLSRHKTQKHKLAKLMKERFNPELSETDNMRSIGYLKIFDCGQACFTWTSR